MQQLIEAIHKAHQLLLQVKADALTQQLLSLTEKQLNAIDVHQIIEEYARSLPEKNNEEDEDESYKKQLNTISDHINKELAPLNSSLGKIKQLRETLNLPALDGIIGSSQKIVRAIYQFTSNLNAKE